mmetsp:Transcript_9941/g.19959  ORF Transcript_9941/g.19959 Transcript_9941/m.19959 type:complete len:179 (+) Transcript_9941:214-750(+)
MPSIKYFGLAQLCGSFIDSVKEKCSPCFPIEWCGVGINATTDVFDGRYDPWLHRESPHPLDRYEQKAPPIGDIKFHEKDVEEINRESKHADDMGLNPYCLSPSTSTRAKKYRMRFGVKRGLKRVSCKLRSGKKKHRFGLEKTHDSATISTYPTQELVATEAGFLYPVQEEADADDSVV